MATLLRGDIPPVVVIRVATKVYFESPTGCRVSTYSTGSHGYAQVGWHSRSGGKRCVTLCHRVVWMALYGDIPEGMTIDHMCKNRRCVNIEHLRMLTNFENARRTSGRDWALGECANGHPSKSFLRQEPNGRLRCTACTADAHRRHRAKKRLAA